MLAPDPKQRDRYLLQLKAFRDRLLSIDTRNPSIFLRRPVKKSSFDVRHHLGDRCGGLLLKARKAPTDFLLISERDESEEAGAARASITQLLRFSDARTEETGLKELFLGFCWAEGFVAPEVYVRGPLALLPIRLEHRLKVPRPGWYASFDDPTVLLNRALLGTLRKHKGYSPDEALAEAVQKAFSETEVQGDTALHDAVVAAFLAAGAPLQAAAFDPEARIGQLSKADLAQLQPGPLTARSYLVIGMFRQASTALYMDLDDLVRRVSEGETDQGIIDNLLDAGADDPAVNEANFDEIRLDEVPDAQLNLVMPSDPSQDQVVVRAQKADCVVVRGPPGTGKSQVIVNLVSDALSRGERVLVVCQKRAALDVVHQRMQQVGLGDCAFVVHDESADRPALYERMAKVLTSPTDGPPDPEATARLSREADHLTAGIRAIVEPLREKRHGLQVSDLYKRAKSGFRPAIQVPLGLAADDDGLTAAAALLGRIEPGFRRFDVSSAPVAQRCSWADLGHVEQRRVLEVLERVSDALRCGGSVRRIDDPRARNTLLKGVEVRRQLGGRWYRYLVPAWHLARGAIARNEAAMAPLPLAEWPSAVRKGEEVRALLQQLGSAMSATWVQETIALIDRPPELAVRVDRLAAAVRADFGAIQQHDLLRRQAAKLEPLVGQCGDMLPDGEGWEAHLIQAATLQWIEEAEAAHPSLKGDPLASYEALRTQLQACQDRKREAVRSTLARTIRHRAVTPVVGPDANPSWPKRSLNQAQSAWTKLSHEVTKKRRVKPLRTLVSEFPHPFRQVTPCWLASPEVVAEVFPLERGHFDLVIFDEASQLAVERALPVLYRAKRVVIAGDEQQMPPSDFFESAQDDAEEEGAEDDPPESLKVDSLLVLAKRIYGQNYLGWHYRSEHQELIEYSNHAFYGGTLNIAANVNRDGEAKAITWVPVSGQWIDKRNLVEATKAVDLLHEVLRDGRDGKPASVAIATFNIVQADAVKDEIERRREEDDEFAELLQAAEIRERIDDRPVVKNIENIQGDERDVVIFSVGYAQGVDGVLRKGFGPLSKEGGENRLNVAVTRARKAIYVVCSFDPDTLAIETAKNIGPMRFKQYLQYAKAVSTRDHAALAKLISDINPAVQVRGGPRQKTFESPFEEQVHDRLVARGYLVDTQIGLSGYRIDLGVVDPKDPTRYCLGIECDGAQFHSGKSVRERDLSRQRFLESKGWRIARIWSRNWWLSPEREVERLVKAMS